MKTPLKKFLDENALTQLIESYFASLNNKRRTRMPRKKITATTNIKERTATKEFAQQPTITGLALHLGFDSLREFDEYERRGKHARLIKRACLKIEVLYEQKLLQPSPNGAIFLLKSRGWNEKPEDKSAGTGLTTFKVKMFESGPEPVSSEKEIIV